MINKIPHFLQDHKKIIRSVWYSSNVLLRRTQFILRLITLLYLLGYTVNINWGGGGGMCSGHRVENPP